jgi:hypothetical protein
MVHPFGLKDLFKVKKKEHDGDRCAQKADRKQVRYFLCGF